MFDKYNEEEDEDDFPEISQLVEQFEEMHRNGTVGYFEVEAFLLLLDYYEDVQQLETVELLTELALAQHPDSVPILVRRAGLYFDTQRESEAMTILTKCSQLDPLDIEPYFLKAEILASQSDFAQAHRALETALSLATEATEQYDILLAQASIFEEQGYFDKGFEALAKALRLNPDGDEALDRIWLIVELSEMYDESIALHNELIDANAYSHKAWFNLGHAHFCKKEYQAAADAYDTAFTINEKFEVAYRDCGEALMHLGKFSEAIEVFERAIANNGNNAYLLMQIGLCYEEIEEFFVAHDYYIKAAQQEAQNPEPFFRMGENYGKQGRWQNAASAYRKAIQLDGTNAHYYVGLAVVMDEIGDFETADKAYEKAIRLDEQNKENWLFFIASLIDREQFKRAAEWLGNAESTTGAEVEYLYCEAGLFYRQDMIVAALGSLLFALSENREAKQWLFEFFPDMEKDARIQLAIKNYEDSL